MWGAGQPPKFTLASQSAIECMIRDFTMTTPDPKLETSPPPKSSSESERKPAFEFGIREVASSRIRNSEAGHLPNSTFEGPAGLRIFGFESGVVLGF